MPEDSTSAADNTRVGGMESPQETMELLTEVPIFALLDDQERADLVKLLQPRQLAKGEVLFRAGDVADSLFVIQQGSVEVVVDTYEGERLNLLELEAGDVVGEVSFLDGGPRTATVIAREDCRMLEFDREELFKFVTAHPHAALDLLTALGKRLRSTDLLLRNRATKNVNVEEEEMLTFGNRVADKVARFGGSWPFILTFLSIMVVWVTVNEILEKPFDLYPFILLNLFLSMLAALQAPVIMMSQNRQAIKDRIKSDLDYQIDLKAELEIAHLHKKVDQIYESMQAYIAQREKSRRSDEPLATASAPPTSR